MNKEDFEFHLRNWDKAWELWTNSGCKKDDPKAPIPGPHPDETH